MSINYSISTLLSYSMITNVVFYIDSNVDFILKEAVKIMAKDLVRTRNFIKKFYLMKANLQAVSLKIQVCTTPCSPTH